MYPAYAPARTCAREGCGVTFHSTVHWVVYCSAPCRNKASKQRSRARVKTGAVVDWTLAKQMWMDGLASHRIGQHFGASGVCIRQHALTHDWPPRDSHCQVIPERRADLPKTRGRGIPTTKRPTPIYPTSLLVRCHACYATTTRSWGAPCGVCGVPHETMTSTTQVA